MDLITVVAIGVSVLSSARLARLIVHDHWPPVVWVRKRWDLAVPERAGGGGWNVLLHCHVCMTVWTSFGVLLWGHLTDFNEVWWWVNIWLAVSYAAMYVVTFDGIDS